ncbi:MAG: geranylgeranyl reductase family protein [Deltaproteobacteria bacterium]|nr:geranylgeranyl reductase family protein [Deltaproteobacteria bacterium]
MMYDLIIIGGGPAGSAAGRIAGQSGLNTLLLDKEDFPRNKLCGGALSERALSYLDFEIPPSMREKEIFGMRVRFSGRSVEGSKGYRIATIVTRRYFDNLLFEKAREAGVDIKTGEKVIDLREDSDHVEVVSSNGSYRSRFLLIAEGAQGRLKERVRKRDTKWEYGISLVANIQADNREIDARLPALIEIHPGIIHMGYGWIFPHDGYYSVGIWGPAAYMVDHRSVMKNFLLDNGFSSKQKIKGHVMTMGGIRRDVTGSRIVFVGDAAGFMDPFSGEGIAFAIRSGQIAAEVISDILLRENNESRLKEYEKRCYREFGHTFQCALLSSRIMNRFPGIFFDILTRNTDALDHFLEIPNLRRQYLSYLGWIIPRIPKLFFSWDLHTTEPPARLTT